MLTINKNNDRNVGEIIKELRKTKGITQSKLAALLNVSPSMISQYESGIRSPKIETLQKIADALEVSVDFFMPIEVFDLSNLSDDHLEPIDRAMLIEFQELNDAGKRKALEYVYDLEQIPDYRKE